MPKFVCIKNIFNIKRLFHKIYFEIEINFILYLRCLEIFTYLLQLFIRFENKINKLNVTGSKDVN